MPASGETTTEEAKTFNGRIVKENGEVILKDPVTKVTYKLDDSTKARQYMGKQVKVTGKLDMNSNTIRVESIEPMS
jgi:predicted RNA-binding protein